MIIAIGLSTALGALWLSRPALDWPDRRPIGALFLADHTHASEKNPRGWFNQPDLDLHGPEGKARFKKALIAYVERSILILRETGAQGMIAWDLEGEEFPHKTTYIGDPRLLDRLAPEIGEAADDFFRRFRSAGFRVGLTIRPQQLVLDTAGSARQTQPWDYDRILLEKIDYARNRWGATLFYIDSNGGPLWPAEVIRLRRLAKLRPDVLLIPEHHDFLYYGFSAPFASMDRGAGPTAHATRILYPNAFQVLAVSESASSEAEVDAAYRNGDILLFSSWFHGPGAKIVEKVSRQ